MGKLGYKLVIGTTILLSLGCSNNQRSQTEARSGSTLTSETPEVEQLVLPASCKEKWEAFQGTRQAGVRSSDYTTIYNVNGVLIDDYETVSEVQTSSSFRIMIRSEYKNPNDVENDGAITESEISQDSFIAACETDSLLTPAGLENVTLLQETEIQYDFQGQQLPAILIDHSGTVDDLRVTTTQWVLLHPDHYLIVVKSEAKYFQDNVQLGTVLSELAELNL